MSILQKFFICVMIFLASMGGVFANGNKTEVKEEQKTLQTSINSYILEIYKFQGNKIVQDLADNLEKVAPTKAAKIEAYNNIQETLKLKKSNTEADESIGKNTKIILIKYLDHIVKEIDNKKAEL